MAIGHRLTLQLIEPEAARSGSGQAIAGPQRRTVGTRFGGPSHGAPGCEWRMWMWNQLIRATGLGARTVVRRGLVAVAAVLALTLAGCAGPVSSASPDGSTAGGAGGTLGFTATTLDGQRFDGSSLAGEPVALWFWAPWCSVCRTEAPAVAQIAEQYAGEVTVVGVAGRAAKDAMREFVAETGTGGIEHVADTDGALSARYGVVTPTAYAFIDRSGTVRTVQGGLGADELRRAMAEIAAS